MKGKVFGIHKEAQFCLLTMRKDGQFFDWLAEFLKRSFENAYADPILYVNHSDPDADLIKKDIKDFTDVHERYGPYTSPQPYWRADVMYGKDRVFVMVFCPDGLPQSLGDALSETTELDETLKK